MYNRYQEDESWEMKAAENGWTPPKQTDGSKGFRKVVLWIIAFIVICNIVGNKRETQSNMTDTAKKTASQTSVLPGSAREAVMNGELELADIQHRADALGWSTDAWQEWYYIANQTGTSMEAVEKAAAELNKRLEEAPPEFVEGLKALGISLEEAKAMKPEELFEKVIYGLQAIED